MVVAIRTGYPMSPESAWKATLGDLELQMTKATFKMALADLLHKPEGVTVKQEVVPSKA